jgi:hypothetical protein
MFVIIELESYESWLVLWIMESGKNSSQQLV